MYIYVHKDSLIFQYNRESLLLTNIINRICVRSFYITIDIYFLKNVIYGGEKKLKY